MIPPILAGIETEYGFVVDGRSASEQVEDATDFVRAYPGPSWIGWDYRYESPRSDLRGFRLERLAVDPTDLQFDRDRDLKPPHEIRADRVLTNGARFYNDHGHPEYATPECWSLDELMLQDLAGEVAMLETARAVEANTGVGVQIFKNNTDFHGASYGTHEGYLCPRSLGFEGLYKSVMPMLVARTLLCGAGKVGSESGARCDYQRSQRADFMVEAFNAETLFRRPVFNTRDEAHSDPAAFIRLHVISGDANRIPSCTRRKVGLVKIAIALARVGEAPVWRLRDPVRAFQSVSRDLAGVERLDLDGANWTTPEAIIESYLDTFERIFEPDAADEHGMLIAECRGLLADLRECPERFSRHVDWAAKQQMLSQIVDLEGLSWDDKSVPSYDLAYHRVDPDESLFDALVEMDAVEPLPPTKTIAERLERPYEGTRALARSVAVTQFPDAIITQNWGAITLQTPDGEQEFPLDPEREYGGDVATSGDLKAFIRALRAE